MNIHQMNIHDESPSDDKKCFAAKDTYEKALKDNPDLPPWENFSDS